MYIDWNKLTAKDPNTVNTPTPISTHRQQAPPLCPRTNTPKNRSMASLGPTTRFGSLFFPPKHTLMAPHTCRLFEGTLALRIDSLLPIPSASSSACLLWISRSLRALALVIADAAVVISDSSLSGSLDFDCLNAYLDYSIFFLDACNAASAEISRIGLRLLQIRVALCHLSVCEESDEDSPRAQTKDKIRRKAIKDWESAPSREIGHSAPELIRKLGRYEPPYSGASDVRRVTYAVLASSRLVLAALTVVLGGEEGKSIISEMRVSSKWPWAEAFNKVAVAVSIQLRGTMTGELEALEEAARRLAREIDGEEGGVGKTRLWKAVDQLKEASGGLVVGLNNLNDSVNGAFREAMGMRNAVLKVLRTRARW